MSTWRAGNCTIELAVYPWPWKPRLELWQDDWPNSPGKSRIAVTKLPTRDEEEAKRLGRHFFEVMFRHAESFDVPLPAAWGKEWDRLKRIEGTG